MRASRAGLAVFAIVVVLWSLVFVRNEVIGHAASGRIYDNPRMSAAEWDRAMEDFRRAELLDPGTKWAVARAHWLVQREQHRAALRAADSILGREPDNLDAWFVVLRASEGVDPARTEQAQRAIERLNPPPATNR